MKFLGWVLRDGHGHAHIVAINGDGTVVMRDCFNNEWRVWGDQTFNEGSLQIQQVIESWERRWYERSDPVTIEVPVDPTDLLDRHMPHNLGWMDRLFEPFLDMAGIIPLEPAVPRTIHKARLAGISFTAAPLPGAAVGDVWFDTSANGTYVYNGGSWNTMKGIV